MGWNDELDTIWLELARDLEIDKFNDSKKQDGSKIYGVKSEFNKFDIKLIEQLPFNDSFIGFKSPEKNIMIKRNKQYKILMDKQLFLARLENSLNKGTSWEEEDDDF
ncbi:MAG TPA: hypothetical protein ENI61_06285 [Ignavibacteria bacterium]|nr:hypothetical protein [Ignavibacteria bacterium]